MAHINTIKGNDEFTMELGGKQRTIKYDLNAYGELENRYGTVEMAMKELQTGNIKALRMILWTGLIHEEANVDEVTGEPTSYNITPFQVGSWVAPGQIKDVSKMIGKAMTAALPEADRAEIEKEMELALAKVAAGGAVTVYTEEEKAAIAKEEEEKKDSKG